MDSLLSCSVLSEVSVSGDMAELLYVAVYGMNATLALVFIIWKEIDQMSYFNSNAVVSVHNS